MTTEDLEQIKSWLEMYDGDEWNPNSSPLRFWVRQAGHLLAEVERLRAEREWQPIETAPKDGMRIIVQNPPLMPAIVGWDSELELWMGGWADTYYRNPTHWMPLPEPPKVKS